MIPIRAALAAAVVSAVLGGCAIHPLPEHVTGVDTPHIVRQIRCETREAIKATLMDFLRPLAVIRQDPIAQRLVALYEEDPEAMVAFNSGLFPGRHYVQERAVIDLLLQAGIAYTFDFNISEDNDLTANVNLLRDVTPKFALGLGGSAKRKRANERTFTVTDTFSYLLAKLNTPVRNIRYCDGHLVGPNYVYPIAGRIGVDRTVKDFARLLLFGGLAGKEGKAGAAPTMTDDLTFITTVSLSANPKVVFAPVAGALHVGDASLDASVARTDKHQVTIGLAVATGDLIGLESLRSFLFSSERDRGTAIVGRRASGRQPASRVYTGRRVTGGGTPSEILAVIAVDQVKSAEFKLITQP